MMKNYQKLVKANYKPNRNYITDHPHRILIISGSALSKTDVLLNVMKHQRPEFMYMLKIHSSQSINYLSTEEKK